MACQVIDWNKLLFSFRSLGVRMTCSCSSPSSVQIVLRDAWFCFPAKMSGNTEELKTWLIQNIRELYCSGIGIYYIPLWNSYKLTLAESRGSWEEQSAERNVASRGAVPRALGTLLQPVPLEKSGGKAEPGESSPVGEICSCITQVRMIGIGHRNYYFNQSRTLMNRNFVFWVGTVILCQQIYLKACLLKWTATYWFVNLFYKNEFNFQRGYQGTTF